MTENTKPTLHLFRRREGGTSADGYGSVTGRVPEDLATDKLLVESELKKDLRMISNSWVYFALRVQATERIQASHRALATKLAEAKDTNKLQLAHIAELKKQLATVTEERDLLRTMIINAVDIHNPSYVDSIAKLIRASTHVTHKLAAIQEVLKTKGMPILKTHVEKDEGV